MQNWEVSLVDWEEEKSVVNEKRNAVSLSPFSFFFLPPLAMVKKNGWKKRGANYILETGIADRSMLRVEKWGVHERKVYELSIGRGKLWPRGDRLACADRGNPSRRIIRFRWNLSTRLRNELSIEPCQSDLRVAKHLHGYRGRHSTWRVLVIYLGAKFLLPVNIMGKGTFISGFSFLLPRYKGFLSWFR